MITKTIFDRLAKAASAVALFLILMGAAAFNADAQSSRITIRKDFCASIGESNTCNGIPTSFPSNVVFTVELGTYNVATGVFTQTSTSANVNVAIGGNANGFTTADATFSTDTIVRVCEIVPLTWNSIPRPENSGGGEPQYAQNNCLIVDLGPGNNDLKFINGPGGSTAGDATINGRVRTGKGGGVAKAEITIVNGSTGEVMRTLTNPFGYYSFEGLDVNELYIITVRHKRYSFEENQRSIMLSDSFTDMDFVARPVQ